LYFIENEGMAFGMKFGEDWGKLFLTLFRLVAVVWGFYFIQNKQMFSLNLHDSSIQIKFDFLSL
jgi:lipoprotein signal peptidase